MYIFILFFYFLLFNFFFCHVACGILVPWPRIEPLPFGVEVQSLNHWTAREVPQIYIFKKLLKRKKLKTSQHSDKKQVWGFVGSVYQVYKDSSTSLTFSDSVPGHLQLYK